jgi:Calcineurin-like phosphoesterase
VPTFVVGDVHGHLDTLIRLLRDAGLVDRKLRWSGRDARLWLLGDLVDRGPDGVGTIDLVMRLEREGPVRCVLGNHEAMLLAVSRFASGDVRGIDSVWRSVWRVNGGQESDLARFTPEHAAWVEQLPAVARDGDWLLLHSDTDRYLLFGRTVEEICDAISTILRTGDGDAFEDLFGSLADRNVFEDPDAVDRVLETLGGKRIVHGHTPIAFVTGIDPGLVTQPLEYGGGRVLNVDHCLFAGGPGFVTELPVDSRDEVGTKSSDTAP